MPGSDKQHDLVRVKDERSNSKADTFFIAPKEVGRDGAGLRRLQLAEVPEPPDPPSGEKAVFLDESDSSLKEKDSAGTVAPLSSADRAPDDAQYVTLATDGELSDERTLATGTGLGITDNGAGNDVTVDADTLRGEPFVTTAGASSLSGETVANQITDVYGTPVPVGIEGFEFQDIGTTGVVGFGGADVDLQSNDITNANLIQTEQVTVGTNGSSVGAIISDVLANGEVWADNGNIYTGSSAIQDAENAATNLMVIGPGTYTESVTVDTSELSIIGASRRSVTIDGGTTGDAIDIQSSGVAVEDIEVKTSSAQGNSFHGVNVGQVNGVYLIGLRLESSDDDGIHFDGSFGVIAQCEKGGGTIDGDVCELASNSSDTVVDTCRFGEAVADNGAASNVVGDIVT